MTGNRDQEWDRTALENLFTTLAEGSTEEIKAVRKELERHRYQRVKGKSGRAFVLAQIERVSATKNPLNRAALIRGLIAMGFSTASLAYAETIALILKEIQHQNGTVREAARRLAGYLRFEAVGYGRRGIDKSEEYREFLRTVGTLLKTYRGSITELHIEKLKPSVYRSLALLFLDANNQGMYGTWLSPEETTAYNVPVHEYEDPYWVDENELDTAELEEEIWKKYKGGSPDKALSALQQLEKVARKRLADELTRLGFLERDADAVVASLATFGNDYGPAALTRLIDQALATGRVKRIEECSGIVRALQGYANHRVQRNANDEPFSDFLINVLMSREGYGRHKPEDFAVMAETVAAAHEAIDLFCTEWKAREEADSARFAAALLKHDITDYPEDTAWENFEKRHRREVRSITHHALDWYFQAEPWNAARIEPRKLAALSLRTVERINTEWRKNSRAHLHGISSAELSSFGGWASPGGVHGNYGIESAIMTNAVDPELFYLNEKPPN